MIFSAQSIIKWTAPAPLVLKHPYEIMELMMALSGKLLISDRKFYYKWI